MSEIENVVELMKKRCEYNRSYTGNEAHNLHIFSEEIIKIVGASKNIEELLIELISEYMEFIFIDSENTQTEEKTRDVIKELSNFACLYAKDTTSPLYQKIKRKIDSMVGARSGSISL